MKKNYYLAIDVGTSSTRCALYDQTGKKYSEASLPIKIFNYKDNYYEQSSNDIWKQTKEIIKITVKKAKINSDLIATINFDATCSLVALDKDCQPVTVSEENKKEQNIILWMDHRSVTQAKKINDTKHRVLKYVGGQVSAEMQIPKILWLKHNLSESYAKIAHFFGLPDFLTFKATGINSRSICSLTCKWNYLSKESKFSNDYFQKIGLADLVNTKYETIGKEVEQIGTIIGTIKQDLAIELGINPNCQVLTSEIDAHCGGIGILGAKGIKDTTIHEKIAIIAGTSSCHMAVQKKEISIPGIWGPYYNAMIPNFYLHEGGQSTSGAAIDYLIKCHPAYITAQSIAKKENIKVPLLLNKIIKTEKICDEDCKDIHILPYLLGNRSPISDLHLKGLISGFNNSNLIVNLAKLYYACVQAVSYGTRHIIETLNQNEYAIKEIIMTGGLSKNQLFNQMHANCTNLPVLVTSDEDAVLLGGAILGAYADKKYATLFEAMQKMNQIKQVYIPEKKYQTYHQKKYQVFIEIGKFMQKINELMK